MTVGVLALQGDFAEHQAVLDQLGVDNVQVRTVQDLERIDRLIIPGGESTVLRKLLNDTGLTEILRERALPIFGTCAGAIVLAAEIVGEDPLLDLIDITIDRNAYGSQLQSFSAAVEVEGIGSIQASFIRAPKITRVGPAVEVLATHEGDPVLVKEGNILVATFHPEVVGESILHQYFAEQRF